MKTNWSKSGNIYRIAEVSQQMKQLPVAVYKLQLDMFEQPILCHISENFTLPSKIYTLERDFIERVKKSWANTKGNFGVLLNGVKGTGKSVTAEIICNEMNLPVIIIAAKYKGMVSFLNDIQQDFIVFLDEYDKVFDRYDNSLLSVMDGVLKKDNRIMFLMTSNDAHLERNMLQRPSRIRYIKTFGDLPLDAIIEIVDDMLVHTHLRKVTIEFIAKLSIITMDLVKSIVEEVNIHEEDPNSFADIFNISDGNKVTCEVYVVQNGEKTKMAEKAVINPVLPFTDYELHDNFYVDGNDQGEIVQITSPREIVVEKQQYNKETKEYEGIIQTFIIEPTEKIHKSFYYGNEFIF